MESPSQKSLDFNQGKCVDYEPNMRMHNVLICQVESHTSVGVLVGAPKKKTRRDTVVIPDRAMCSGGLGQPSGCFRD